MSTGGAFGRGLARAGGVTTLLVATCALAQVFVYPRRPNKSQVRSFTFDWKLLDLKVEPLPPTPGEQPPPASNQPLPPETPAPPPPVAGAPPFIPGHPQMPGELPPTTSEPIPQSEKPVPTESEDAHPTLPTKPPAPVDWAHAGGIRLYYYASEAPIATFAAASIVRSYRDLADHYFHFAPPKIFPYILYSSYQEFLQTNLFPLQEGVLGVTSPLDLKLTLPYLGDDQMFERISRHEMSHEFTFQKLDALTKDSSVFTSPVEALPLWFTEGLAEFYAQRGIDPEAEMLARDLVTNPDLSLGYAMLDFYEDRPGSVLWTYKLGEVRCGFLEETYGQGFIQRVLEASPQLTGFLGFRGTGGFPHLIQQLTGDDPKTVSIKFSAWVKKRAFTEYLDARQQPQDVRTLPAVDGEPNALATTPDGNVLVYRTINETTGQSRLVMVDRRAPSDSETLAEDGVPGIESLHPVFPRNFTVNDHQVAYLAESVERDLLYVQDYQHTVAPASPGAVGPKRYTSHFDLGSRRAYPLAKKGVIAAFSPAFSPDGKRIAFIGLSLGGQRDVYVMTPGPDRQFSLTQLTHDAAAERQLVWGPQGILFTSDNTEHRKFNLFQIQPDAPDTAKQISFEERDEEDPAVLPDGRVFFVAYDRARANFYELTQKGVEQRSDVATGYFDVSAGPEGGLWGLLLHGGIRRPSLLVKSHLLDGHLVSPAPEKPASPLALLPLDGSRPYRPFALHNWEPGTPFAFLGGGTGGIYGQILADASDRLGDHALLLNVALYGSFKLTDGVLLYIDQTHRTTWGLGLFQSLNFRIDESLPQHDQLLFESADRFYGVLGTVRYPFNRFFYVQTDAALGGVSYFLPDGSAYYLFDPNLNGTGRDLLADWSAHNPGPRLQGQLTARVGYDTITYGGLGGIAGNSLLLEGTVSYQPQPKYNHAFGQLRLDAEHFFPISGRTHVFLRLGAGTSLGGSLAQQFFLSSFDTLRGANFGDINWLLGREFLYSTGELRVPLNDLIRTFIFSDIEGVVGVDFGGVGNGPSQLWDKRILDVAVGANFALGPILFRLHFAKPFNIGAAAGAPSSNYDWVTNFSIGYLGLGVFGFGGRPARPAPFTPVLGSTHGAL